MRMGGKKQKPLFGRVAIIGLGLMGASLGLALKRGGLAAMVIGYARRQETRQKALAGGVVDIACDRIEAAAHDANIIVICAPVGIIPGMMKAVAASAPAPGAVVTDVGSVKSRIAAEGDRIFRGGRAGFIGSHPVAGSEQHGLENARADLYRGAAVILTPTAQTSVRAVKTARLFWEALGAETVMARPREHDRIIARTSHLPHAMAALLAACVSRNNPGLYGKFCGGGFRDTTRIAEGEPGLWLDILAENGRFLKPELELFRKELDRLLAGFKKRDSRVIAGFLARGAAGRRQLLSGKTAGESTARGA